MTLKKIVFACVHNAGRSQMAAAWFNHLAGGRAVAISAGTQPIERVHPKVVQAMKEVGNWQLPDPMGQTMERVRQIRDAIKARVLRLLDEEH